VFRFKLLFDHAGTPTNPDDDELIAFLGGVKTAGRSAGYCDAIVRVLG
jgi:hypothetical protein